MIGSFIFEAPSSTRMLLRLLSKLRCISSSEEALRSVVHLRWHHDSGPVGNGVANNVKLQQHATRDVMHGHVLANVPRNVSFNV